MNMIAYFYMLKSMSYFMQAKLCYTSGEWDKINMELKGKSLTHFIYSKINKATITGPCSQSSSVRIMKSIVLDGDVEQRILCQASELGISGPEFIRRAILDPLIIPSMPLQK